MVAMGRFGQSENLQPEGRVFIVVNPSEAEDARDKELQLSQIKSHNARRAHQRRRTALSKSEKGHNRRPMSTTQRATSKGLGSFRATSTWEGMEPSSLDERTHNLNSSYVYNRILQHPSMLNSTWTSSHEIKAFEHFVCSTAPWIAYYCSPPPMALWTQDIPKMMHHLPASRQLLVAVSILDTYNMNPTTSGFVDHRQYVLQHYTQALSILNKSKDITLDIILASLLGWVLEVLSVNFATAQKHITACSEMLKAKLKTTRETTEESQFLHNLTNMLIHCKAIFAAKVFYMKANEVERWSELKIVASPESIVFEETVLMDDFIAAMTDHSEKYRYSQYGMLTKTDQDHVLSFVAHWEGTLHQMRDREKFHNVLLIAAQLLLNFWLVCSFRPNPVNGLPAQYDETMFSPWDFYLRSCEGMLSLRLLDESDLQTLKRVIRLGMNLVIRYAIWVEHTQRANAIIEAL